jgi:hypothetical protein
MAYLNRPKDEKTLNLIGRNIRKDVEVAKSSNFHDQRDLLAVIKEQLMNQKALDPSLIILAGDASRNKLARVSVSLPH